MRLCMLSVFTLTLPHFTHSHYAHVNSTGQLLHLHFGFLWVAAKERFYRKDVIMIFKSYHCCHFPLKKIRLFYFNKTLRVKRRANYGVLYTQKINIT